MANEIKTIVTPASESDFIGEFSTDNIWRENDMNRCLSDDLNAIESDIEVLKTGKASTTHTHDGYAATTHTHDGYAATIHNHQQAEITGLATALEAKADSNHTHIEFTDDASASTYKLIYIANNGNDENTGFSQDVPMATIKGAIRKYAEKYKLLDIRLADGTYNEDIGAIVTDVPNVSIRSISENKDAVIINMASQIDLYCGLTRLYNMTLNITATGNRVVSVNAGYLYAYNVRFNVPTGSTMSCVNVYNGAQAFMMHCVLNAGTGSSAGAAVYGNQAGQIKAINCTSERTNNIGFHAHNGTDIIYTDTITATTKTKETYYGKCTLRA